MELNIGVKLNEIRDLNRIFMSIKEVKTLKFEVKAQDEIKRLIDRVKLLGYEVLSYNLQSGVKIYIANIGSTAIVLSDIVLQILDASGMFDGCQDFEEICIENLDFSKAISMEFMFSECTNLKRIGFRNFNTEQVEDMSSMFAGCINLEEIDLSSFSTHEVKRMNSMFSACEALKNINISTFDTSKVEDMQNMFKDCKSLEQLDISTFDTKQVKLISGIVSSCVSLKILDISNIDIRRTGNSMLFVPSILRKLWHLYKIHIKLEELRINNFKYNKQQDFNNIFYTINVKKVITNDKEIAHYFSSKAEVEFIE